MVDRTLIAAKLAELEDRISRVRANRTATPEGLAESRNALDLVAFNLMLCVQACADVAAHMIADEGWPAAASLAEGFCRLSEHGVVSTKTSAALGRAVGLRNVVAHGYAGVDTTRVHAAATDGLTDLESFAGEVAAWIATRTPTDA